MPELHIITGSNGAGKSTVGPDYLPNHIQKNYAVFDGDKLFLEKMRELFPSTTKSHKEARNIANDWLEEKFNSLVTKALEENDHFVYEGHFSSDGPWQTPKKFKEYGYAIHMIFFGLENQDLSEMRVIDRSKNGGHYVNPIEIDRNFRGNLMKLDENFKLMDDLMIIDTSETQHHLLARLINGEVISCVKLQELPAWFTGYLFRLTNHLFDNK